MKKILYLLLVVVMVGLTGCGKENIVEEKKEFNIVKSYVVDYENNNQLGSEGYAYIYTIVDIMPKEDISLGYYIYNKEEYDNIKITLSVDGKTFSGIKYAYSNIFTLKENDKNIISSANGTQLIYYFRIDKYLLKNQNEFNIDYKLGEQKGEYSYLLSGSTKINKDDIKMVSDFDEMAADVFNNDSEKLMLASFMWKIDAAEEFYQRYNNMSGKNKISAFPCQKTGVGDINGKGSRMNNFFSEEIENTLGLSNSAENYLFQGFWGKEMHADYPKLNYDTLEKYYPGIKEKIVELNNIYNEAADNYMSVKTGYCSTKLNYMSESYEILKEIKEIIKN